MRSTDYGTAIQERKREIKRARWMFPIYLVLINLFVVPIAIAGLMTFPGGQVDGDMFVLLPRKSFEGFEPPAPSLTRPASHHAEWVDAARGVGTALSNFAYAATLTESLLVGNVALRAGKSLEWDREAMKAVGTPEADRFIKPEFRAGWSL